MKKILILQMRPEDETCESEFESILKVGQIDPKEAEQVRVEQLEKFNLDLYSSDIKALLILMDGEFSFDCNEYNGIESPTLST